MGLYHRLIEDTLMLLLGEDVSGVLWARMAFTLVFLWILSWDRGPPPGKGDQLPVGPLLNASKMTAA